MPKIDKSLYTKEEFKEILNNFIGSIDIGTGTNICIKDIRPDLPIKNQTIGEREETLADISILKSFGFSPKHTVENFLKDLKLR